MPEKIERNTCILLAVWIDSMIFQSEYHSCAAEDAKLLPGNGEGGNEETIGSLADVPTCGELRAGRGKG